MQPRRVRPWRRRRHRPGIRSASSASRRRARSGTCRRRSTATLAKTSAVVRRQLRPGRPPTDRFPRRRLRKNFTAAFAPAAGSGLILRPPPATPVLPGPAAMRLVVAILVLSVLALLAPAARAADTVHTCVGFIESVPAVITKQGTWCLRRHIETSIATGKAITLASSYVTLDCNGFK